MTPLHWAVPRRYTSSAMSYITDNPQMRRCLTSGDGRFLPYTRCTNRHVIRPFPALRKKLSHA